MSDNAPVPGSLVLYKIRPALVTAVSDKIDILFENNSSKRVRPKDITLLHPGPLSRLTDLQAVDGDVVEAWELLSGGITHLQELAELIYGDFTPATAWAAWRQVTEGLYFQGTPGEVTARSPEQVETDISEREARAAAEQAWLVFLERLRRGEMEQQDRERLQEVEALALGRSERSRILSALEKPENPVSAHRMLLLSGYWEPGFNPYPGRYLRPVEDPALEIPGLPEESREDLTHLPAFAIDDEGSEDPDDAISLDGDRIWVHVADVAAQVTPDSELDFEARSRGANLYLPEGVIHMLPPDLTRQLGLGLQQRSPALSFGFKLTGSGEVTDLEVVTSWVKVTGKSYAEVNGELEREPFAQLLQLTRRYQRRRMEAGAAGINLPEASVRVESDGSIRIRPLERLESREMVSELMLMTGEGVAAYALEHDLPIPFATQPEPKERLQPQGMAAMYAYRRQMKPSRSNTLEGPHAGLGLAAYSRTTSPLRRYLDLVTHQQLRAHYRGTPLLSVAEISQRIGVADLVSGSVRRVERLSNQHWKLLYLQRNPGWRGKGVVVELQEKRATLIIPELAMETRIRMQREVTLDSELDLEVREVDVPDQMVWFRVKGKG